MDDFDILISQAQGQKNKEWDAERLGKLTASNFGTMMKTGRSKSERFSQTCMNYIYEKVAEILTMSPHVVTGQAIEWGNEYEEQACHLYELQTGNTVQRVGYLACNEYSGGSPDGLVDDDGIIEIKCPFNPANHAQSLVTQTYYNQDHDWQVQGNLMITGRQWCDFITYDPRVQEESLRLNIFRVDRDEERIQMIQDRLVEVKEKLDELLNQFK